MLVIKGLRKSFGGLRVVDDCSLSVREGEIVGLIGPNGAGKTTLFNIVAGRTRPDDGEVILDRQRITGWASHRIARNGLIRTFQIPQLFEGLSAIENMLVAVPNQAGERFWKVWLQPRHVANEEEHNETRAWHVLDFLGLGDVANDLAHSTSGGQKKLLELGRALMARPRILLLDEPVAGVNPVLAEQIGLMVRELRAAGNTFLVIEHNMEFIMGLADRLYVMANGTVLREGPPETIRRDEAVLSAYLGVG